jgi:hypothetical protein
MGTEVNGRPGGVQHPEEGSKIREGETPAGEDTVADTGGKHKGPTGGAEHLRGADSFGDTGGSDLGRGGD